MFPSTSCLFVLTFISAYRYQPARAKEKAALDDLKADKMSKPELKEAKDAISKAFISDLESKGTLIDIGTAFLMQIDGSQSDSPQGWPMSRAYHSPPLFKWPNEFFRPKISIHKATVCEDPPTARGFKDPLREAELADEFL